jgi:hypothetical protein
MGALLKLKSLFHICCSCPRASVPHGVPSPLCLRSGLCALRVCAVIAACVLRRSLALPALPRRPALGYIKLHKLRLV